MFISDELKTIMRAEYRAQLEEGRQTAMEPTSPEMADLQDEWLREWLGERYDARTKAQDKVRHEERVEREEREARSKAFSEKHKVALLAAELGIPAEDAVAVVDQDGKFTGVARKSDVERMHREGRTRL